MTSTAGSGALDRLITRIHQLEQRVDKVSRTPQLANSSLEGGALTVYQPGTGGLPGVVLGQQADGTFGVVPLGGPVPPVPAAPTMATVLSGVLVSTGGFFADPQAGFTSPVVAPMDFKHFEVQVSTSLDFPIDSTRGGVRITSEAGGEAFVPWEAGTPLYARLVCWTTSGKFSAPSLPAGPVPAGKLAIGDLGFDIDELRGSKVFYGADTPTATGYGDLWLKLTAPGPPPHYEVWRWAQNASGDAWVELADQGSADALAAAVAAQQAADSKARIFNQPTAPAYSGAADTAVWFDSDNGNAAYRWDGAAWQPRLLGNGAIAPNSLIASDVFVTGSVTAALLEAIMVLSSIVVAGDPNGTHVAISSSGVIAYADDPVDGIPNEIGRFGGSIGIRNPTTGVLVATIDDAGVGSLQDLNVVNPNPTFGGVTLFSRLWEQAWGVVGKADLTVNQTGDSYWCSPATDAEIGLAEFAFTAQPGRSYELVSEPFELRTASGDTAYLRIRRTIDGTTPTISTTTLREYVVAPIRNGYSGSRQFSAVFDGPSPTGSAQTYRLLMTYGVGNGSKGVQAGAYQKIFRFTVRDVGPQRPNIVQYSAGGGSVSSGQTAPPPAPTAPKTTAVNTYYGNWSGAWRQNGTRRADVGSAMYQGDGDTYNGIQGGAWAWHDITGDLAGSVVNKVELFLYCEWSWYTSGLRAQIGVHSTLNDPGGTWPGQRADFFFADFSRNQGQWIDVTQWGSDIQSGAVRGITLYANTTDPQYYGRFTGVGPTNAPALRVTFTK